MSSDIEHEKLLTPAEVGTLFKVDPATVTRWAKAGRLTSIRTPGGHRRYRETEVRALLTVVPEKAPDPLKAHVRTLWPKDVTGPGRAVLGRLRAAGVETVGDLAALTAGDLEDAGLRSGQVNEVRLALYRKNLALRGEILGEVA